MGEVMYEPSLWDFLDEENDPDELDATEERPIEISEDQGSLFDDSEQLAMFDIPRTWEEHWVGMPSYCHDNLKPWSSVIVHFTCRADRERFSQLMEQTITDKTKSLWYPKAEISRFMDRSYAALSPKQPKYPIYIVSKGRADTSWTSKALTSMNVPHYVVIEPQEFDEYAEALGEDKLLVLPFSNLGQGSIPARNWVWDHAVESGAERHWCLDDNIRSFHRYERNNLHRVLDGTIFRAAEDFVDRYENVALAAMQYFMFITKKAGNIPPYYLNSRCYSCILVRNDLTWNGEPMRWRGRYNEDTDLSLRVLKDGHCTILFNAFICDKATTMTMKGGNSDDYDVDGRLKATQVLIEEHPDCARLTEKFGRPHHHVDYRPWRKNKLILREDATIPPENEWEFELLKHPGYEEDEEE